MDITVQVLIYGRLYFLPLHQADQLEQARAHPLVYARLAAQITGVSHHGH